MITDRQFEEILADATKRAEGDVGWREPRGHWPAQRFRVNVRSEPDWPLFVEGWWNPQSGKLSYTLVHRYTGRIVGLDLGSGHRNLDRTEIPALHKHRWSEQFKARQAYVPMDITAPWDQPIKVWRQFCTEIQTGACRRAAPAGVAGKVASVNAAELGDVLRGSLPALFEYSPAPRDAVRVRTPMLYPDGDLVDVFVVETDDEYLVTDFGDALGWLRMQSVGGELTANQRAFVDDVCLTLGIERDRGQLTVRCRERSDLADAIHRVGQAGVRVADVEFTFRARAPRATIADEVDGWLRAQRIEAARGVRRSGRSGHDWAVDYEVAAGAGTSLVFLVGGDTPAAVWQRAMHVFVGCSDLRELTKEGQPVALVSLFDDSTEWRDDSVNLVREVSRTVMWSQRDELARLLTSGAMPLAPP